MPVSCRPGSACQHPVGGDPTFLWSDGLWAAATGSNLPGGANVTCVRHAEGSWTRHDEQDRAINPAPRRAGRLILAMSNALVRNVVAPLGPTVLEGSRCDRTC